MYRQADLFLTNVAILTVTEQVVTAARNEVFYEEATTSCRIRTMEG
jgi:hypothetical protein